MVIIYTVTASFAEAENIGKLLLERHLCACVNILPAVKSMYWWEGKIETAQEVILMVKTEKEKYVEVETLVKQTHSYKIPAIFAIDAELVEPIYGDWIKNQLK